MIKQPGVRLSLLVKMMFAFLTVIFPLILGYVIMYTQGYNLLYKRVISSMSTRQEYIANTIEDELISIYTRQRDITLNDDISYLIDLYNMVSDYRRFEMISDIQKSVDGMKASSDWIKDVRVYVPSVDRMFQADTSVSSVFSDYETLAKSSENKFTTFIVQSGDFCIINRFETKTHQVRYLTLVEISSDKINRFFTYLFSQHPSDIILASADSNYIFSHVGENVSDSFARNCLRTIAYMKPQSVGRVTIDQKKYFACRDSIFFDKFELISIVPQKNVFVEFQEYTHISLVLLFISLAFIVLFLLIFLGLFNKPVLKLNSAFYKLRNGDFNVNIQYKGHDEFAQLYSSFEYMVTEIRELIQDNYQQKILVQQAELRQLYAQVDPHFLHNSFLNICAMAEMEDYEGIEEMSVKLSQYYQYTTCSNQDIVRLEEEYNFVSLYADIQNLRFTGKIVCTMEPLPQEYREIPIPRFVLQTLAENSYKYGAGSREYDGKILLHFYSDEHYMEILVEDNGTRFSDEKLQELNELFEQDEFPMTGNGLYNAYKRIRLYYKNSSNLILERSGLGGLCARVRIEKN